MVFGEGGGVRAVIGVEKWNILAPLPHRSKRSLPKIEVAHRISIRVNVHGDPHAR